MFLLQNTTQQVKEGKRYVSADVDRFMTSRGEKSMLQSNTYAVLSFYRCLWIICSSRHQEYSSEQNKLPALAGRISCLGEG